MGANPWLITPNGIIAVFTVILAWIGALQWQIFSKQLKAMRLGERVWLSLRQEAVNIRVGSKFGIPLSVANIAKTPAKNIHGWVFVRLVKKDEDVDFNNPSDDVPPLKNGYTRFNQGVMFPNDPQTFKEAYLTVVNQPGHPPETVTWTQEMQGQWAQGDIYILCRARFTYDDAIGMHHWTQLFEGLNVNRPSGKLSTDARVRVAKQ